MELDEEWEWKQKWSEVLSSARQRPHMFIGDRARGHQWAIREPLRLLWQGCVFQRPRSTEVFLSPIQFVVRCFSGPVRPRLQKLFPCSARHIFSEKWARCGDFDPEDFNWLPRGSRFGGSTGSWLDSPMHSFFLARRFAFGIRMEAGLFCQGFESGWPASPPFLIEDPSPVGLVTAGELDPEWFTGLPFQPEDEAVFTNFQAASGLRRKNNPHPSQNVTVHWHPEDDLLDSDFLSTEGLKKWL